MKILITGGYGFFGYHLAKKFLKPSDTQRLIRAYEIKYFTNKSMYEWFRSTKSDYEKKDFYKIKIDFPRKDLIEKIRLRTQEMIQKGAVNEVKRFIKLRIPKSKSAYKAIGINELREYINKDIQMDDVIEKISIKTRQYAKRQSTWARGNMLDWNKISSNRLDNFLKKI